MFLDQLLVTHHVEDQVANAELLGDADLAFGVGQGIEQRSGRQGNQQGERRTLESHGREPHSKVEKTEDHDFKAIKILV
ncbi:hypothetical protein D3C78_1077910 [compost metagenome]